jgi:hypothetical protein
VGGIIVAVRCRCWSTLTKPWLQMLREALGPHTSRTSQSNELHILTRYGFLVFISILSPCVLSIT